VTARWTLPAFSGYGIELEYVIVDRETLAVLPVAAQLLHALSGSDAADVERGQLGWSNELVAHVVELKNIAPTPTLEMLASEFQSGVCEANRVLESLSAQLMPTAMHPWMDPAAETVLWNRQGVDIYRTFDRIFDCRRHGWSNLQSTQINMPFADDAQFARLHAAVRLVVPLLPALAASSPIAEGRDTGVMDYRLEAYRTNARLVPSITGMLIPETVVDRADYEQRILEPMYREIAPHDPDGVLRHEWLNSRAAIARFDRNAIEIRVVDTQECPRADLAIASATAAVVKALYSERWSTLWQQQAVGTETLQRALLHTIRRAEDAVVDDAQFLDVLGIKARRVRAGEVWRRLLDDATNPGVDGAAWWRTPIAFILERGSLSRRILRAVDGQLTHDRLREVYGRLCRCLETGQMFE
jgi:gamma-glutamyl:cysteine ligase YbdK (ATP-grasp superfamily)